MSENAASTMPPVTRRDFLKLGGVALASLAFRDLALPTDTEQTLKNIDCTFFFVMHMQAKDLTGFKDAVLQADVIVPEAIGWTPEEQTYYKNVSQGRIPIEQIGKDYQDPYKAENCGTFGGRKKRSYF